MHEPKDSNWMLSYQQFCPNWWINTLHGVEVCSDQPITRFQKCSFYIFPIIIDLSVYALCTIKFGEVTLFPTVSENRCTIELMTLFLIFQFKVEEGNELWFPLKQEGLNFRLWWDMDRFKFAIVRFTWDFEGKSTDMKIDIV